MDYLAINGGGLSPLTRTTIGGSALNPSMVASLASYGVKAIQLWGMTETSPLGTVATSTPDIEALEADQQTHHLNKQGRMQFGIELRIVDDNGARVPHDGQTAGALQARGPWVCSGYFGRSECLLTSDGWMPTGDIGTIDEFGYLQLTDRAKDIIKSGGEWIGSLELESVAAEHPAVAQVAVVGVPHPQWEERPVMIVQCAPGYNMNRELMHAHLKEKVAKWWLPDEVLVVQEMPYTGTGKIMKSELRRRYNNLLLDSI